MLGLATIAFQYVTKPEGMAWFRLLTDPNEGRVVDSRLPGGEPGRSPDGGAVLVGQNDNRTTTEAPAAKPESLFPKPRLEQATDELLAPIRDDGLFSSSEHQSYFTLLDLMNTLDPQELEQLAEVDVPFSQLYGQPQTYRGRIVKLRGLLRAAYADLRVAPNPHGIEKSHTLWVSPIDQPKRQVYQIHCLQLPDDLPRGETKSGEQPGEIEFVGLYYKRLAYRAKDDIRTTPLILAKTVRWSAPKPVSAAVVEVPAEEQAQGWAIAIGVGVCAAGGVLWLMTRKPTPDPKLAKLMAFSTHRLSERSKPLDDLRNMEVAPEVLAALHPPRDDSSTQSS